MSVDTQMTPVRLVCAQIRSKVGTQLALRAELNGIGNQVVDPWLGPDALGNQVVDLWLGPDPLGLLLPRRTDCLTLLNVDLKVPRTETPGLLRFPSRT